jgi:hypothetical protein
VFTIRIILLIENIVATCARLSPLRARIGEYVYTDLRN